MKHVSGDRGGFITTKPTHLPEKGVDSPKGIQGGSKKSIINEVKWGPYKLALSMDNCGYFTLLVGAP